MLRRILNIAEKGKMAQSNGKQISRLKQIVFVILVVGVQLIVYFLPPYLPYPLFIKDPELGSRFFFLIYTVIFLGGISSGIALGWRYLPAIVLYLAGTTIPFGILLGMQLTIEEATIPAGIWGTMGGIFGSLLNLLLGQRIQMTESPFKFLLRITVGSIIVIVIFGVASGISSSESLFFVWGPIIFIGIAVGILAPANAAILVGISQTLLCLVVVLWLSLTVHGEGALAVVLVLLNSPIFIGCSILGALYGSYLRNHFLEKT